MSQAMDESFEVLETIQPSPAADIPLETHSEAAASVTLQPAATAVTDDKSGGNVWGFVIGAVLLAVVCAGAWFFLRKKKTGLHAAQISATSAASETVADAEATEVLDASAACQGPVISVGMAQTIGARENQQDSMYCSDWNDKNVLVSRGVLAAVADGIGGLKNGDTASSTAVKTMRARFAAAPAFGDLSGRLLELCMEAHKEVVALNRQNKASCGTTLVAALLSGWNMTFLSIGDSRIYLYRAGTFLQLNREHVLRIKHQEQQALNQEKEHASSKPEALTSFVGKEDLRLIDRSVRPIRLVPGDKLLMMSDGVFGTLSDEELLGMVRLSPQAGAEAIIQKVNDKKKPYQDNASVLMIGVQ